MGTVRVRWLAGGALAALTACGGSSRPPAGTPAAQHGLDRRPANLICLAPARGASAGTIALSPVFTSLPPLSQPLALMQAPEDDSRWFVLEKAGRVRVFANDPAVAAFDADFIDLRARVNDASEGGLLGMAFHPDFATNGQVYLSWTEGTPMTSVIARFTSLDGGQTLDPGSLEEIIRVNQDFTNHNGGQIAFGPDGYLYVGLGDGGSAGDPNSRAQDTTNLLGDFLRLDVDGGVPYAIPGGPHGNPFAGNPPCPADHSAAHDCPEIFAWGFRNPWRWSFDAATGVLWAGDVGQGEWEEIDHVERGGNYGWDCREGAHPFAGTSAAACSTVSGLVNPVHEYSHAAGDISVTGGFVYRGQAVPGLTGQYVFGDFGSGRIWRLVPSGSAFIAGELLDTQLAIASFGQGNDNELYVVDLGGTLHRLVESTAGGTPPPAVAAALSASGCVDPAEPSSAAQGMIPYEVGAPFWSDGASKERWLAIPDGTSIAVEADGDFSLPSGSVLMQHFRLNGRLIETRLLMRHPDGEWAGYSYEWNAAQSDALLVEGGKTVEVEGQPWAFPSGNECLACHTSAAGFSLGLEAAQLNHDLRYASTGRTANQLEALDAIAMFASPLPDVEAFPVMPDPADAGASLEARARAYLHTNCAQCHRPAGPTASDLDLRFSTSLAATHACDAVPQAGDLDLADARIIAPGDPARSVLTARVARRDANGMPPLASALIDTDGVALLTEWIGSLEGCN